MLCILLLGLFSLIKIIIMRINQTLNDEATTRGTSDLNGYIMVTE